MRKNLPNFKAPSNAKTIFHDFTRSEMGNISGRPSQEPSDRRKQSLPSSGKNEAGLMAQIKQALKNKEADLSDNVEYHLNEVKRAMCQDIESSSRNHTKENRTNNA